MKKRDKTGKFIKNGFIRKCLICKKDIYFTEYFIKNKGKKFCSKNCFHQWEKGKHLSKKSEFKKGQISIFKGKIRLDCSKRMKGNKNPNWKGGITDNYHQLKNTNEWKVWRKQIFERDNYTCQDCKLKNGNGKKIELHPHHLFERNKYPELMFKTWNGRTLCKNCHHKVRGKEKKYREILLQNWANSVKLPMLISMPNLIMDNAELNDLFFVDI